MFHLFILISVYKFHMASNVELIYSLQLVHIFVYNSLILCSHLWLTRCCNVEFKQQKANHFSCTVGSQEPWCGDAWCQQGEHSEPACGCSVWGSRTALHGSVHSHPGGRGAELAARAGGAFQGSARERRYHALSLRPSPLASPEPPRALGLVISGPPKPP